MNNLVSFVLLSYNNSNFIEKTIISINNQSYNHIELIVVDDGSNYESLIYLKKLKELYNFQLIEKTNGGVVSAINYAIKYINGKYTIFHANDDISHVNRVSEQLNVFSDYPDACFVSSNINIVDKNGLFIKRLLRFSDNKKIKLADALIGCNISSVGCMYKTIYLKKICIDEKYIAEDPQIHFKILEIANYAVVNSGIPILNYYLHESSQMSTRLHDLLFQHVNLMREYKNEHVYELSLRNVEINYLSYLAEFEKKKCIIYFLNNFSTLKSKSLFKILIKLMLPVRFIRKFKLVRT